MPKAPSVEYVLTKPNPQTWWKKNRHLVLLVVGLLVGGWLVGDHDGAGTPSHPGPEPPGPTAPPAPGNGEP